MARVKPGEVTRQEDIFAKEFVKRLGKEDANPSKAAREAAAVAYKDTKAIRTSYVYQVLGRDRVQKYITTLLTKAGLSHESALRKLNYAISKGLSSDKATLADALKGLDMVLKLHNMYPATKIESRAVKVTAELSERSNKQLKKELEELEGEEELFGVEEGEVVEVNEK